MTRMQTMFSMKSTRLAHSLISISTETRVSSFPTHPHACQKKISSVLTGVTADPRGKGVFHPPPTLQPFAHHKQPQLRTKEKGSRGFESEQRDHHHLHYTNFFRLQKKASSSRRPARKTKAAEPRLAAMAALAARTHGDSVGVFLPDLLPFFFPIFERVVFLVLELHGAELSLRSRLLLLRCLRPGRAAHKAPPGPAARRAPAAPAPRGAARHSAARTSRTGTAPTPAG